MILTMDVDLAERIDPIPYRGHVWLLARFEDRVLGEMLMEDVDLLRPENVERKAIERFAPRIHALNASQPLRPELPLTVSVVVMGGQKPGLFDGCLRAIAAADPPATEVLLVEGVDITRDLPERTRVVPGGRARDELETIMADAKGEILAMVDERCRPDRRFVTALQTAFAHTSASAVTGIVTPFCLETHPQLAFDRHVLPGRDYRRKVWSSIPGSRAPRIHPMVGGGIAWRRADVEDVGFEGVGDQETRRRLELGLLEHLVASGKAVLHHPDFVMWHVHPGTRGELLDWVRAETRDRLGHGLQSESHWLGHVSASLIRNVNSGFRSARHGRQLHLEADLVDLATTSAEAWRHLLGRGSRK